MGTHPIFESDFDCLTEYTARANMTWGKDETANMARGDNDDGWGSPEEDHTPQQQRCQFKGQQANQNRNNNQPVRDKKQSNPELYFEMEDFDGGNQGGRGGGGGGSGAGRSGGERNGERSGGGYPPRDGRGGPPRQGGGGGGRDDWDERRERQSKPPRDEEY